jgi:lauroyl/myristoyl acyltransferase
VPIVPAHCEPLLDGRYRLIFHPKIDKTDEMTEQQIAQTCWNSFEPYVRKNPAPWLWMYKHWRYKPTHADRKYPFYAQQWRRFDQMVERAEEAAAENAARGEV